MDTPLQADTRHESLELLTIFEIGRSRCKSSNSRTKKPAKLLSLRAFTLVEGEHLSANILQRFASNMTEGKELGSNVL
jgi:hypothetical protein